MIRRGTRTGTNSADAGRTKPVLGTYDIPDRQGRGISPELPAENKGVIICFSQITGFVHLITAAAPAEILPPGETAVYLSASLSSAMPAPLSGAGRASGSDRISGSSGIRRISGTRRASGRSGACRAAGRSGARRTSGTAGAHRTSGAAGTRRATGIPGTSGSSGAGRTRRAGRAGSHALYRRHHHRRSRYSGRCRQCRNRAERDPQFHDPAGSRRRRGCVRSAGTAGPSGDPGSGRPSGTRRTGRRGRHDLHRYDRYRSSGLPGQRLQCGNGPERDPQLHDPAGR